MEIAFLVLLLAGGLLYSVKYGVSDDQTQAVSAEAEAEEDALIDSSDEDSVADSTEEAAADEEAPNEEAPNEETPNDEAVLDIDLENAVEISLTQDATTVTGSGASVLENVITISSAGTYRLSGTLENGQIYVDADGSDFVVLVLDGVDISNESDPAIYIENAKETVIYLVDGSENRILSREDTGNAASEGEIDENAEGGAIYARDDLTISGAGTLEVTAFLNNGIQTSNDLLIESGTIVVDAVNNGIKGKDSVTVTSGSITVTSGSDGIKSDDTTGEGYGLVTIEGGEIRITSAGDGIQAETVLTVSEGSIQITSGGGSADAETVSNDFGFGMGGFSENWDMADEDAESTKGIKSGTELNISGGPITVDSYDDSLHSNGTITISGGSISTASRDDGIHADTELTITDGSIGISQSYEGLEGNQIRIEGGEIEILAADDGINANGGTDSWNNWGGWGNGEQSSEDTEEETPLLLITGGMIFVNAQGDGLDSNGDLTIEGGSITVDGPSDSSNGAIDSGTENGGSCTITGGTVLAVGASGIAETFDSSSGQCSFLYSFSANYAAGSVITISDADGKVLFEHTAARSFSSLVFSSPELEQGSDYQITIGQETTEITLASVSGSYSQQGEMYGNQMRNW